MSFTLVFVLNKHHNFILNFKKNIANDSFTKRKFKLVHVCSKTRLEMRLFRIIKCCKTDLNPDPNPERFLDQR